MRVRIAVLAAAACGLFALSGCQLLDKGDDNKAAAPTPAPTATPSATPSGTAKATPTGKASASGKATGANRQAGTPDVCALLTRQEVTTIAGGRQITQIDPDGEQPGATVRNCQWQLSGARLAIFLSPTTSSEFKGSYGQGQKVNGVGDEAAMSSGHLYVRHGNMLIDVYATVSGNEAAGNQMAKNAALKIIEKL
jgi:hypothetical protein